MGQSRKRIAIEMGLSKKRVRIKLVVDTNQQKVFAFSLKGLIRNERRLKNKLQVEPDSENEEVADYVDDNKVKRSKPTNKVIDENPSFFSLEKTDPPKRSNIIAHLEQKYGGGGENRLLLAMEKKEKKNNRRNVRRRGGKKSEDDMDSEDENFIDDSLIVEHVEHERQTKRLKTKYDGFFVSSGNLETEGEVHYESSSDATSWVEASEHINDIPDIIEEVRKYVLCVKNWYHKSRPEHDVGSEILQDITLDSILEFFSGTESVQEFMQSFTSHPVELDIDLGKMYHKVSELAPFETKKAREKFLRPIFDFLIQVFPFMKKIWKVEVVRGCLKYKAQEASLKVKTRLERLKLLMGEQLDKNEVSLVSDSSDHEESISQSKVIYPGSSGVVILVYTKAILTSLSNLLTSINSCVDAENACKENIVKGGLTDILDAKLEKETILREIVHEFQGKCSNLTVEILWSEYNEHKRKKGLLEANLKKKTKSRTRTTLKTTEPQQPKSTTTNDKAKKNGGSNISISSSREAKFSSKNSVGRDSAVSQKKQDMAAVEVTVAAAKQKKSVPVLTSSSVADTTASGKDDKAGTEAIAPKRKRTRKPKADTAGDKEKEGDIEKNPDESKANKPKKSKKESAPNSANTIDFSKKAKTGPKSNKINVPKPYFYSKFTPHPVFDIKDFSFD